MCSAIKFEMAAEQHFPTIILPTLRLQINYVNYKIGNHKQLQAQERVQVVRTTMKL